MLRSLAAASAALLLGASLSSQQTIETFNFDATTVYQLPGTVNGPNTDFNWVTTGNTLAFTPGSVTFMGQPIDFSGTEAQFLSTNASGSMSFPVLGGPAQVDVAVTATGGGGAWSSTANGTALGINLGPGFSANNTDIVPGGPHTINLVDNAFQSSAVPALNGTALSYNLQSTITSVNPVSGIVNTQSQGSIDAPAVVPTLSTWGLVLLSAGLIGFAWFFLRGRA